MVLDLAFCYFKSIFWISVFYEGAGLDKSIYELWFDCKCTGKRTKFYSVGANLITLGYVASTYVSEANLGYAGTITSFYIKGITLEIWG